MSNISWPRFRGWKKYVVVYVLLLMISHVVIWVFDGPKEQFSNRKNIHQVVLQPVDSTSQAVKVRYEDTYRGKVVHPPVLLLLPGGPAGASVFKELVPKLSSKFRLIIPHLPGDGNMDTKLPDYSFKSLADYSNLLLKKLDLKNVHIVGYGLGGAGAIYLSHDYPERVKSLSLISSIGVQELALLGSYKLNHAVYGVQLGIIWFLHNAIPHFGFFNALNVNVPYAKSYYDSDQRPLRTYLKNYQKPMLILHGRNDALVPLAVANEHHRIVPQSTLKIYNADHDLLESRGDSVATAISTFISEVEQGKATTGKTAAIQRVAESKQPFSKINLSPLRGGSLYLLIAIIILGTLISEDLTCIGSGLLVARGLIEFWPATLACLIGIFMGDLGLYLAGRVMGRPALRRAPFKWFIKESDLKKSAKWFENRGPVIIFVTRFLPGSRLPTYFTAGVIRAGFLMFATFFLLAAIVWTPLLVGIAKILGTHLISYFAIYRDYAFWGFIGALLGITFIIKIIIPLFSFKGRRLLLSRYRQLVNWEYWSPIILYFPVFTYVIYLGIKYRCMTLFTAANPAIPDGGFVGESKTDILHLFKEEGHVARFSLIPGSMDDQLKIEQADRFIQKYELTFPVVLKPDVGQRGQGVKIIRDCDQMQKYLSNSTRDIIVQEYVYGREFGVFYYRHPRETEGEIFSITSKELLEITGDGESTIEQLILEDDRAVNLATYHLSENEERLLEVPEQGEKVVIVELGTHARGAFFKDGNRHITSELKKSMNSICNAVDGFYFGRFDIKVPSVKELEQGKSLKIIEINGVTSESTNIYDSKYTFWAAQKVLRKQWELAFEIGEKNRRFGAGTTPLFPFLKRTFNSLSRM